MGFFTNSYVLAFIKFAVLATFGEILAGSISRKRLFIPAALPARMMIWGVLGIAISFMMKVYYGAMVLMIQPDLSVFADKLYLAFATSAVMNFTFAPAFMLFHKHTDTYLDLKAAGKRAGLKEICDNIDYHGYIRRVLIITLPLFWLPAHTVTFLLPESLRVLFSAILSIVLGLILSVKTKS
ncbi:MAG: hypothetical protein Q4A41_01965 [Bacillota bacterium]|nr:hypothetical protein [Bacillota bacterium]